MPELNPPEQLLGFWSPALGPWFDDPVLTLPPPEANLSVRLSGSFTWHPPATGLLSLLVKNDQEPSLLAGLKEADSSPAFESGSLIALFRLLPEVEERLDALLSDFLPSADGAAVAAGTQRRARIRHLALEIREGAKIDPAMWDVDPPASLEFPGPAEQAEHLGLELAGNTLRNSDRPMRDLKRPGRFALGSSSDMQVVLRVGGLASEVFLWAFDDRGLAVDPGAVAAWWATLAQDQFEDQFLWAPGLEPGDLRTVNQAQIQQARTVHLVNPHEGRAQELETEVTAIGLQGSGDLRRQEPFGTTVQISLASAQADRPRRIALLPNGTFAGQVTLWPAGGNFPARDFVRVAMVDLDRHLVGPPPVSDEEQEEVRASARPVVRATADAVLIDNIDAAAAAIRDVLNGAGERHLVTSVLDRDWGAFPVDALPSGTAFPNTLADPAVSALSGGGEADGDTVGKQRILVDLTTAPEIAGAWVRGWPHGFDVDAARHLRLNGGAAPVRADGEVTLVVDLPPGNVSNSTRMGMDVLIVTAAGSRLYTDLRFDRPAPVAGAPISIAAAQGPFTICETGLTANTANDLTAQVPPGATLVSRQAQPALIDPASLGAQQLTSDAILPLLTAGLSVSLTVPAFRRSPRGSSVAQLASGGASVEEVPRSGLQAVTEPGAALPGQERLEVVAGRLDGQDARTALATSPALARFHESLPHQVGHPGVPAIDEQHGAGATLTGPAALPAIEYMRDRTNRATLPDLFNAARNLLPTLADPAGPVRWTAFLRTVSAAVEGEPALALAAETSFFPFGQSLQQILNFFANSPIGVPPGISANIPEAQAVARALDRRIFTASRGAQDALRSLREAFSRAEHFIYIETPAIDALPIGGQDRSAWSALLDRLQQRRGLHVLVCHPVHLMPGTPLRLEHVRNEAIAQLPPSDRVELFSVNTGPARSLHQSSTTVIVDDAYALTGSTHLWRRGLTFDSSVAVSMFDESLERGRPQEIRAFRRSLIASRLGIAVTQLPENPAELLLAIRQLRKRGGGHRLATEGKETPEIKPTDDDLAAWDRDGTPGESPSTWLNEFLTLIQSGPLQDALGDEVSTPSGG